MRPYGYGPGRFGRHGHNGGSLTAAFVLISIGIMFLAGTVLPDMSFGRVFERGWPLLLVGIGVLTFVKGLVMAPFRGRVSLTGPLVLVTIGVLFTLSEWYGVGFERTWPVLLLVIGLSILMRKLLTPLALFRRLR